MMAIGMVVIARIVTRTHPCVFYQSLGSLAEAC